MADGLSVVASVIAVIQITERVITVCRSYIQHVKDHPKEIRVILLEVSSLKAILENLPFLNSDTSDSEDSAIFATLLREDGLVSSCKDVLEKLERLISPSDPSPDDPAHAGSKRKWILNHLPDYMKPGDHVQEQFKRLRWPAQASRARGMLEEIMRYKTTISLAIGGEALKGITEVKRDIKVVRKVLDEAALYRICSWLEKTNPSADHNSAIERYEPGTGEWVIRCQEWNDWVREGTPRCLWISGIPGAGKTILASYLTQTLTEECKNDRSLVTFYYYCLHSRNQDESIPMLRWLVGKLCRHTESVPTWAEEKHRRGEEPTLEDLYNCLASLLEDTKIQAVYFVVDALDESQDRERLLMAIHKLVTEERFVKLRLLVSSREYHDIEEILLPISSRISMSNNPEVQSDIDRYITAEIARSPKLCRWSEDIRSEVQQALSNGAQGMFRWVVCQLDIIRRLKTLDRIRANLKKLPKDIFESYERIFLLISEADDKALVQHALHWLLFYAEAGESPLSTTVLSDACSLLDLVQGNQLGPYDIESIKESCGCLIRIQEKYHGSVATIAHYTVREFLESSILPQNSGYFFRVVPEQTMVLLLGVVFETVTTPKEMGGLEISGDNEGSIDRPSISESEHTLRMSLLDHSLEVSANIGPVRATAKKAYFPGAHW
ncbi:hypothetical protein QBC41DRAFT_345003 [Cercophora samala]|uniref:NACHT domain-containing protein n=1 Tax=Cercophora samala TaxID=330535 RepID=A0AA40DC21_9PEZI|nr:hypothetical protein QBC41DRAFT_345003 [Cercophora samala]